jgi:hypothetical protein
MISSGEISGHLYPNAPATTIYLDMPGSGVAMHVANWAKFRH